MSNSGGRLNLSSLDAPCATFGDDVGNTLSDSLWTMVECPRWSHVVTIFNQDTEAMFYASNGSVPASGGVVGGDTELNTITDNRCVKVPAGAYRTFVVGPDPLMRVIAEIVESASRAFPWLPIPQALRDAVQRVPRFSLWGLHGASQKYDVVFEAWGHSA